MTPRIIRLQQSALCASLVGLAVACTGSPPSQLPSNGSTRAALATGDAAATADPIPTLTITEQALAAGTYRMGDGVVGTSYPSIVFTVPDGWTSSGPFVSRERDGDADVVLSFWVVGQVYGHPCEWEGTLFQPGPTVEDLANALVQVPLRNATQPSDVTLDGSAGKYLEWSVPGDIPVDEDGNFVECDSQYFESWTGLGMATDRYHQGAGQVDQVWILDVDGDRLIIDASSMPASTAEDRQQLMEIVQSIRFERES